MPTPIPERVRHLFREQPQNPIFCGRCAAILAMAIRDGELPPDALEAAIWQALAQLEENSTDMATWIYWKVIATLNTEGIARETGKGE